MVKQDEFDSIEMEDKRRKRLKMVYLGVGLYFVIMFFYTISISNRDMMFYTKADGSLSIPQNHSLKMRVSIIGSKEMIPLRYFFARLELEKENGKQILFSGTSGEENFIEINTQPLNLEPGEYDLVLFTGKKDYGNETNKLSLVVTKNLTKKEAVYQKLDEKLTTPFVPIKTLGLVPDVKLKLVCGNGRFIPNLNNNILLVAEAVNSSVPVSDIEVEILKNNKTIAGVKTDQDGMASFMYYAHSLGGEFVDLLVKDTKGNSFKAETKLQPTGSQVVLSPEKYWFEMGENIPLKIESLGKGSWFVDVYNKGNLVYSDRVITKGAPIHLEIPGERTLDGILQIQLAENFSNPNTSFDVTYVYVNNPKKAAIRENDERLKKAKGDPVKIKKLENEYAFNAFLKEVENADFELGNVLSGMNTKIFNTVSMGRSFDRHKFAEQLLRELPKSYILLNETLNTSKSKYRQFIEQQRGDRFMALVILGISGLFVVLVIVFRIWLELKQRDRSTGIKTGGQHIVGLITLLGIIIVGYIMMLYLFSILDWYKDL